MKKLILTLLLSMSLPLLQSCLPLVAVGGAAAGAFVGSDPRTSTEIKDDMKLYGQINQKIGESYPEGIHVTVTVLNGKVLFTGEVPDERTQRNIARIAQQFSLTKTIYNQTMVGPATSLGARTSDSAITAKVKTALLSASFSQSIHIKVLTERGIVYLIGRVPRAHGDDAANIASHVKGVERVVRFYEYVD